MELIMLNTVDFWLAIAFSAALVILVKYAGSSLKKLIDVYVEEKNKKHLEAEELLELSRKAHQDAQLKVNNLEKDFVHLHMKLEKEKMAIQQNSHDAETHLKETFDKLLKDRRGNLERHAHLVTQEHATKIIKESLSVYFAHNWDHDRNNQLIISQLSD